MVISGPVALLGHRTPAMAAHYTRGANQKRLATAAVRRLPRPKKNPRQGLDS